jgi:hypothetical protein
MNEITSDQPKSPERHPEIVAETRQCPRCQSADVRRFHRRGMLEYLLSVFGYYPYLCYGCGNWFFRQRKRRGRSRH